MAFVNERFTQEDKEKLNIESMLDYFRYRGRDWTADHEREMYLMCVDNGMMPDGATGEMEWVFIWHGKGLIIGTKQIETKRQDTEDGKSYRWAHEKVDSLSIYDGEAEKKSRRKRFPEEMYDQRDEIFNDFKEARNVYKGAGIYSTITDYELVLDIKLGGGYVAHL